jgi:hypothetical protein
MAPCSGPVARCNVLIGAGPLKDLDLGVAQRPIESDRHGVPIHGDERLVTIDVTPERSNLSAT